MVQPYRLTQICHIRHKKGKAVQNQLCLLSKYLTEDVSEMQYLIPQAQVVPTATDSVFLLFLRMDSYVSGLCHWGRCSWMIVLSCDDLK